MTELKNVCVTAAVCTAGMVGLLATPQSGAAAFNVFEDCRFSSARIRYAQHSDYTAASTSAISAWDRTATPITFSRVASDYEFSIIDQDNGNSGYDGITYRACGSSGHYAHGAVAAYNTYYTFGYSGAAREQVMVHEIGHALGLAHSGSSACNGQPIMFFSSARWFQCGHRTPQPDDVNGVNFLYR